MAIFNPDIPDIQADYTRNSQGYKADNSLAGLFENAGNLFETAVKGADSLFKKVIRNEATAEVDEIRDREIDYLSQANGYGNRPKEIDNEFARLGTVSRAARSGQIGGAHYDLLLDASARRLRSRYPGHREYIDNVFQDLTGTTPANRAIQELRAASNKGDPDSKEMEYLKHKAMDQGGPLQEWIAAGNPDPTLEQARKWVYGHAKLYSDKKAFDVNVETEEKSRKLNQTRNLDQIGEFLRKDLDNSASAIATAGGLTWDSIKKQIAGIDEARAAGRRPSADQEEALKVAIGQYKQQKLEQFQTEMNKPRKNGKGQDLTWGGLVGEEGIKTLRERHLAYLDDLINPIINKDYGRIATNTAYIEASQNEAIAKIRHSNEFIASLSDVKKMLGDQTFATFFGRSSESLNATQKFFNDYMLSKINKPTTLEQDTQDTINKMKQSGLPVEDMSVVKGTVVNNLVNTLKDPKSPAVLTNAAVHKLFSDDPVTKDFYAKASPNDKEFLYQKLLDPKVTENIFRTGTQEMQDKYKAWVDTVVGQRMLQHASDVRNISERTDNPFTIIYDPKTLTFRAGEKEVNRTRPQLLNESSLYTQNRRVVHELNRTINHWKPVVQQMKFSEDDMRRAMEKNFSSYGIDLKTMIAHGGGIRK